MVFAGDPHGVVTGVWPVAELLRDERREAELPPILQVVGGLDDVTFAVGVLVLMLLRPNGLVRSAY